MKSVMLLEGGSYRGVYTSGVLDVFMEHDIYPDCVVGVSAGSLNGLGYVARQPGRSRDIVLNYGMDPRYVGVKALRREHNLVGFDFILREAQQMYPFDAETFFHSKTKFYAVATNCRTGQQEYIDRDEAEDILTAVAASSSMPFFCRKVRIGGEEYLDGGTGLHLPLGFLKEHPEYDRVAVVLTRRLGYRKSPPGGAIKNLAKRLYRNYPALLNNILNEAELYAAEREELLRMEQEGRVLIVQPKEELPIGKLERDTEKLKAGYAAGRADGEAAWQEMRAYLLG